MAIIKNAILRPIQRLIGIAPAPQQTVLDDDSVSLTFPIVPDIARRSLSGLATGGWHIGVLENVHSAGDAESSSIEPYSAGPDAVAPYPIVIGDDFDLWLLFVHGLRSSGSGGLTGAVMGVNPPDHSQGWGRDDQGDPVLSSPAMRVAFFDDLETTVTGVSQKPMIQTKTGALRVNVGMRIPRGSNLAFHTVSAAAAEFQAIFVMGLFPASLGQDVAS